MSVKFLFRMLVLLVLSGALIGGPGSGRAFKVKQPDGSQICLKAYGDEFLSYVRTDDGYTVVKRSDGWYVYAVPSRSGYLMASDVKVSPQGMRSTQELKFAAAQGRNLMPSDEIIRKSENKRRVFNQGLRTDKGLVQALKKSSGPAEEASSTVTWNILVICVDFSDDPSTLTTQQIDNFFNQTGFTGGFGSPGSFNDYFRDISYGKFGVVADVKGWYRAPQPHSYYNWTHSQKWARSQELTVFAMDQAEADGVDYSKYDNDGDGIVEQVLIVHAGLGAAQWGENQYIWPHKNNMWSSFARTYDGVSIAAYTMQEEMHHNTWSDATERQAGLGMYVHEFGHALGLPDLYAYTSGTSSLGNWSTMASGSWLNIGKTPSHYDAWCKEQLGWVAPTVVTSGQMNVKSFDGNADSVKRINISSTEYFLITNRTQSGFDAYLPGAGMNILHIDTTKDAQGTNPKKVMMEQADGLNELNTSADRGDSGDLFPGSANNRSFTNTTNPDTKLNNGNASGVSITSISNAQSVMSATVSSGNTPPSAEANGPYSATVNSAIQFSSNGSYDQDGSIVSYSWNFGDGTTSTLTNPSKTYSQSGNYTATLTVTDNGGATGTDSAAVTVNSQGGSFITTETEPNGSPATASGPVGNNILVSGGLSSSDYNDYYFFNSNNGTVNIEVTTTSGAPITWVLYKASDTSTYAAWGTASNGVISGSYNVTTSGKYIINVYTWSSGASYTLKVTGPLY